MSEGFDAHERIHSAGGHEGHAGSRWTAIAAAVFAVLAALATLLGNTRATASNSAKSDAIIAQTRASDAYNEYEARSIKRHLYESAAIANPAHAARLSAVARTERKKGDPLLPKARDLEEQSRHDQERAERLLGAYETIEVGATLLEIAIVLVSISSFTAGRLLPVAGGIAAVLGLIVAAIGMLR